MTPDEIREICVNLLPMRQKESHQYLAQFGLNKKNADVLRHLLGTTKPRPERYSKELREECRRLVEEEGLSIVDVAKQKGLFATTVYNWHYAENWNVKKGHDFWSEMKIRLLVNEVRKGTKRKTIAMKLGCSRTMVNNMWNRLNRKEHVKKWVPLLEKLGLVAEGVKKDERRED